MSATRHARPLNRLRRRRRGVVTALVAATAVALSPVLTTPAVAAPASASSPAGTVPLRAGVDDFQYASFHAEYTLSRDDDGTARLRTVETLVADFPEFPQNRGILRGIPNSYDDVPQNPTIISITDETGTPVPYEVEDDGDQTNLALGDDRFLLGPHTFVITYDRVNAVRAFEDTQSDEFYIDTTGFDRLQSIGAVTARIVVDPALESALTDNAACYVGPRGSTERCTVTRDGTTIDADGGRPLGPDENVSIAVGFAPGTFTVPTSLGDHGWASAVPFGLLGLGGVGVAGLGVARRRRWNDHPGRGTIIAQYSVPSDINLLESAELIGRSGQGWAAELVSFAVRGNVRLRDAGEGVRRDRFSVEYVHENGLDDQERRLIATLFSARGAFTPVIVLDRPEGKRDAKLRELVAETPTRVRSRGFRARPTQKLPVLWLVLALGGLVLAGVVSFVIMMASFRFPAAGFAFLLSGPLLIAVVVMIVRPWRLTEAGRERKDYLEGMKVYLDLAEKDRFAMLQSVAGAERRAALDGTDVVHIYEQLLPFAVLWGIEDSWGRELALHYEQSGIEPHWYVGTSSFRQLAFINALSSMNRSAAVQMAPPVSDSGGSFSGGSFGGGFSGGGMGGGSMGGR